MRRSKSVTSFLLILTLLISLTSTTAFAAKPTAPPTTAISITVVPATPSPIPVGPSGASLAISSTYDKSINWTVSTTLGSASISPLTTKAGSHYATLSISSLTSGTGIVSITATDSVNRKIKATKSISVTFVAESSSDDLVYVALGDSIPDGYYNTSLWDYLGGGTDSNSYVEQMKVAMGISSTNYYDKSVSGYNSIDVLNQIYSNTELIQRADVITLCVGGNDIMDAMARTLSGLDKYNVDWTRAEQGRDAFEANWYRIIDNIENMNSDVTLIVMTVYNPYRLSDAFYSKVDPYFEGTSFGNYGLNYMIRNTETLYDEQLSDNFDYRVVDIHKAFNDSDNKDSLTGFYNSFCDPHPNQVGHNLIFSNHYLKYNN